jgi:peptidoglycan/LPS O-acetylase OafA/YrhL
MKKHYYWIDLIRFFAAFLVMLGHLRQSSFVEFGLLPDSEKNIFVMFLYLILRIGHEAVLIFFVLSGFLVGGRALEKTMLGNFNLKDYTIDRIVRIMLPLTGALIFLIIINFIIGVESDYIKILGNFFSLQGILVESASSPLWSLSYEVWFYVLFGALCIFFIKKKSISLAVLILCFIIFTKLNYVYLLLWLIGVVFYHYKPKKISKYRVIIYGFFTTLFLIGMQLTSASRAIDLKFIVSILDRDIMHILFALSFSLLLVQLIHSVPKKKSLILINKIGTKWALFSYTLYLTHMIVIGLLRYLGFPKSQSINSYSILLYLTQAAICLIFAYIIYLLFEKHTYVVKKWVKSIF